MRRLARVSLVISIVLLFTVQVFAIGPEPKKVEKAVNKIFRNFLHRAPSSAPYQGAPKRNEKKEFKNMLLSANGRDRNQLFRALQIKIKGMIDILTRRAEYRNAIKPIVWNDHYWRQFVMKVQREFERKNNPNPVSGINHLVKRAIQKKWGSDVHKTQEKIMQVYKEGKYYKQYVQTVANGILVTPPPKQKFGPLVTKIFIRFLYRKPSRSGGAHSEFTKFKNELASAKNNNSLLRQKIEKVVNIITDRNEFRDKAGYADWTIAYWTKFIQHCAKTFEGRNVGPDRNWANEIVVHKGKYKNIHNAQNAIMSQYKKSSKYKNWIRHLAH